ncbi:MAG: Na+/H+ antiporter NhaA [Coriobacteriaceae bacterium]|nr:Na+/H+ antiporter NhaA [Coriobacteriaceae bacterium]
MTPQEEGQKPLFIAEVRRHQERYEKLIQFTSSSTKAAAVMLLAAIAALIIANTDLHFGFSEFWNTEIGFSFGEFQRDMTLSHIINDILMAVFFLLVGLEIKYEMTVGELTNIRQALLPIVAAFGGVIFPILIYTAFNADNPLTSHGWGVPTATDIAFVLGIMSLLGSRVPNGLKVFVTTLAVADDIIAILIIAEFYGHSPSILWLLAVAVVTVSLVLLNRNYVYSLAPYIVLGIVLWYCVFMSGVHSTIAGVILAFTIPSGSRVNFSSFIDWTDRKVKATSAMFDSSAPVIGQHVCLDTATTLSNIARQAVPPAKRLEHMLYPWVYFAILPLFALTNAGVRLIDGGMGDFLHDPALPGILFGLLLGKPIGIVSFSFLVTKFKFASLPENVNWMHMIGGGILGGVGFTMAIFVANLAFDSHEVVTTAKLAILLASALAGLIGFLFLWQQARKAKQLAMQLIQDEAEQSIDRS